jgi:two-component system catabolic regulation response regulator CreB
MRPQQVLDTPLPPMKILVVEDDPKISEVLDYALRADGHEVRVVRRGRDAVALAGEAEFVLLDVGLPDIDGFEVCRLIRKQWEVPILFLTSRSDEVNRVVGLEVGGDDYVVKPFSVREVTARIKAIRRRSERDSGPPPAGGSSVRLGEVEIDPERVRVAVGGHPVALTRQEFRLLELFASHPGRVFTRDQILSRAWEDGGCVTDRTIDAHVKSLRRKLGIDCIETVRGIGYRAREF